eukprot:851701-Prorocentrum_minimum.AAC.1
MGPGGAAPVGLVGGCLRVRLCCLDCIIALGKMFLRSVQTCSHVCEDPFAIVRPLVCFGGKPVVKTTHRAGRKN